MIKIILLILLLLLFTILYGSRESFQSTKKVLTSQQLNLQGWIKDTIIPLPNQGWDYVLFKLINRQNMEIYKNPDALIIDSKDYAAYASDYKRIDAPKGYFCILTSPNKKDGFQCGYDWNNKKIAYLDRIDKNIIDSILYGHRANAKFKAFNLKDLDKLEEVLKDVDIILTYVIPNSPMAQLLASQNLYLLDFKNIDLDRLRITYPEITLDTISLQDLFGINRKIASQTDNVTLLSTSLIQIALKNPFKMESFISRIQFSKEFTDQDFKCIGDEKIQSKMACESPYDNFGRPKNTPNVWDKPCTSDTECPYYQANKNYPNTRGKCLKDGTCEMPIGVLRVGYTKALNVDPYQPFCYQCRRPTDKMCCEDQQRLVELKLSNLKSADYAFPNDAELRKEYKLPTTILI